MNEKILNLALDAGLLNYVDNETPRRYFVSAHAEIEDVEQFAELIVQECVNVLHNNGLYSQRVSETLCEHFGVEE